MIAEAEDAIVAAIESVLGQTVQTVEILPGPWDQDALSMAFRKAPGVWVYWDGGRPGKGGGRIARLEHRFLVYAMTDHASGHRARQRGNSQRIGAYEIIEKVVPTLAGQQLASLGSLMFDGIRVLTSASSQRKGIAVYEMAFIIDAGFPAARDAADLSDFALYTATHQVGDGPDTESSTDIPTE